MNESEIGLIEHRPTIAQVYRRAQLTGAVTFDPTDNKIHVGFLSKLKTEGYSERLGTKSLVVRNRMLRLEGQIMEPEDVATVQAKEVLQEVLGVAQPQYVLRGICQVIPLNKLITRVDVGESYEASEKVPSLVEPEVLKPNLTPVEFELDKNEVHIVVSDEAAMMSGHDARLPQVNGEGSALARAENRQIAALAETATGITGTDWGVGTNNPYDDIGGAMDAIENPSEGQYPVDFIAAHARVWLDFFSNPFVRGVPGLKQALESESALTFPVPGLPGVTGFSARVLTNTIALVGSTKAPALAFGNGPTENGAYRGESGGYDAWIIRQWLQPKLVKPDAIRQLTGVHA